jgi:predicted RNA-binding protein with RPS1 domain
VEVYVLRLDLDRKRIGLSLKRLQPEPWALVEDKYELGQLIEGTVTNVVDFGAFAEIDEGIEGLIHVSELTDGSIAHPREVVKKGDLLLLRIIRIDARRKRLGLSLKRVLESEWAEWAARLVLAEGADRAQEPAEKAEEAVEPVTTSSDESDMAPEGEDSDTGEVEQPTSVFGEEPVIEEAGQDLAMLAEEPEVQESEQGQGPPEELAAVPEEPGAEEPDHVTTAVQDDGQPDALDVETFVSEPLEAELEQNEDEQVLAAGDADPAVAEA